MRAFFLAACVAASCAASSHAQPAPAQPAPQRTTVPFTPLGRVEKHGDGPVPMVLIPGANFDGSIFKTFMERNADRYTMYAVTLPGFGGTEPPAEPEGGTYADGPWLENAEAAVVSLLRNEGLDRPVLLGHQLGGHLAMRIAAAHPDAVRSVIAVEGMPAFPIGRPGEALAPEQRAAVVERAAQQFTRTPEARYREGMKQSVKTMVRDPRRASALADMAAAVPVETAARYHLEMLAADASEEVRRSPTPMLMIATIPPTSPAGSPEQLREHWSAAAGQIPQAQLVFFESTLHFVTEDAPADLDRAVAQFVAGEPVSGRPAPAPTNPPR